jgi:exosortase A
MGDATMTAASPRPGASPLRFAPWLLVVAAALFLFRDTGLAMVSIWWRSETYTHAFLVAPISAWLIWRRREAWLHEPVKPSWPWLLPLAGACLLWLMGELASVNAASQVALVAVVVISVPAVLGWALTRQIIFPLLFLFFSVPIGEFLTDPMIAATADFTVAALRFTGIPVYREGMQFVIPSGNWSVVEACSGVRYLIASFMVGTLFAYLNYNSWQRRLAFVVVSLLTPVVANWLRAYMIVMLGHYSGNKLAVGADHLVYGWVFFGFVIMLMFWIGGRFAEPELRHQARAGQTSAASTSAALAWGTAAVVTGLLAGTHALQWRLDHGADGAVKPVVTLPDQLPGGWEAASSPLTAWEPVYPNASATATRTYRSGAHTVGVWVGFYRHQNDSTKMVTSSNRLVEGESREWLHLPQSARDVALGSHTQVMRSAQLRTPADPKSTAQQRLNVLYVYRVGGELMVSDAKAKLKLALQRLLGQSDDSAVIFFYAQADDDDDGNQRLKMLESFVAQQSGALIQALDAVVPPP